MASQDNYVVWFNEIDADAMSAECIEFDENFKLMTGESLLAEFPRGLKVPISVEKKNYGKPDSLNNMDRVAVISEALKKFIEAKNIPGIELFPIVLTHKGKPIGDSYFVLHTLDNIDCIDAKKSKATLDRVNGGFKKLATLVIDEAKIDAKRLIFHPAQFDKYILVRRSLAEEIGARGFTGIRWVELEDIIELDT
jgi:hypothetical protein